MGQSPGSRVREAEIRWTPEDGKRAEAVAPCRPDEQDHQRSDCATIARTRREVGEDGLPPDFQDQYPSGGKTFVRQFVDVPIMPQCQSPKVSL